VKTIATATTRTNQAGEDVGREADFSTALLTKCVSSFGRNDGCLNGQKKTADFFARSSGDILGAFFTDIMRV
jgi:hypothetical protein